jgi:hypothetical protein
MSMRTVPRQVWWAENELQGRLLYNSFPNNYLQAVRNVISSAFFLFVMLTCFCQNDVECYSCAVALFIPCCTFDYRIPWCEKCVDCRYFEIIKLIRYQMTIKKRAVNWINLQHFFFWAKMMLRYRIFISIIFKCKQQNLLSKWKHPNDPLRTNVTRMHQYLQTSCKRWFGTTLFTTAK